MYFTNNSELKIAGSFPAEAGSGPENESVTISGLVEAVRTLGQVVFLILRGGGSGGGSGGGGWGGQEGRVQVLLQGALSVAPPPPGAWVSVQGWLHREERAPQGWELSAAAVIVLSRPGRSGPCSLAKPLKLNLETELAERAYTLRHYENWCRFKVQAAVAAAFRETLADLKFQEIFTPKLGGASGEGGSNVFKLNYFGREATLAQSPQLYKQIMVGVFGRVFEVGPVFRAEAHATTRHLNEYISLDWEAGCIDSLPELMALQAVLIQSVFERVRVGCWEPLQYLKAQVPEAKPIPVLSLSEAQELLAAAAFPGPGGGGALNNAEEQALGGAVLKEYGSELVFVTGYHAGERPFYTRESSGGATESFDLLFRGREISTGGLRIHQPELLRAKMSALGMRHEPFAAYLAAFDYGLPPHGGAGTGLERLTARLTGVENIRRAALFPRDCGRLEP